MNKNIIIAIVLVILLGIVGYFLYSRNMFPGIQKQSNTTSSQQENSYKLKVTSDISNIKSNQPTKFSFIVNDSSGRVFKDYEIAHEKIMHFIAVRKDLANFLHLHPEYDEATGEFSVEIAFPEDGAYRLFPDFTPGVNNPDKLPVTLFTDVEVGDQSDYYAQNVVVDTEDKKTYGDYEVAFDFPDDLQQGKEINFSTIVSQNGKPVTNLENYLGALGHSVVLKVGSLDFIHTHAEEADGVMGPEISFATTFPQAGIYKVFTQFQHLGNVITTDYIISVEQGENSQEETRDEMMDH